MTDHAVVLEQTSRGWSAYVPDLPGPGVAGSAYADTEDSTREGIDVHLKGFVSDCSMVPIFA